MMRFAFRILHAIGLVLAVQDFVRRARDPDTWLDLAEAWGERWARRQEERHDRG